ncbi:MAG: diguanylate cyclase, partial [Herbaspirillum sp.]
RLRQAIERIRFDFACQVAISIGVASRRSGERSQDLFRRADEAMLCGKQTGRNQVGVASFDSSPITIFDTAPKDRRHTDLSV